jgi:hypothetical protein
VKSKVKSVLIIFFDVEGIIHKEFILAQKCAKTFPQNLAIKELTVASC